ncbi:hypothetical protein [Rodentibacter pneumotropicus]|uniref:hypothetical protein n=1 Tax=Rodentibacter pneumotropicus TaxID=758 RepID=UPI00109D2D8F|nr:hypothetical protein [Rodentibacter pneumotropicus]NBH76192.1 hypothetical protein [Rodentibacter pneumotropicus]THA08350.1 hypothetical protein D3M73_00195 [Rodentibacter pneumotropicus]THA12572.1 hypothetical protein D3M81_05005 [Rodentibacter pneumotropicus]
MARQRQTTQSEKDKKLNTPPSDTPKNDPPVQDNVQETEKDKVSDKPPKPDENNDTEPPKPEGHIIEPIAYAVKLRSIHPQASYGRAGFRFTKTEETVIEVSDITPEQVILLVEDPWLELVPVCEE